jgi:hypothetical protein
MVPEEYRRINHAICLLGDELQDEREDARKALHALFRQMTAYEAMLSRRAIDLDRLRRDLETLFLLSQIAQEGHPRDGTFWESGV